MFKLSLYLFVASLVNPAESDCGTCDCTPKAANNTFCGFNNSTVVESDKECRNLCNNQVGCNYDFTKEKKNSCGKVGECTCDGGAKECKRIKPIFPMTNKATTKTSRASCNSRCKEAGCGTGTLKRIKDDDCIGADMNLYSCTEQMYLPAREISIGDSVRAVAKDGSSTCSDVYFSFFHEDENEVVEIVVESTKDKQESKIVVSGNHLVYSGSSGLTIMAKNVRVGDLLVSSDGSLKKVVDVKNGQSALVNILTLEGNIELQNGVVISSYSFHETLYAAAFYPVKMMYWMFGGSVVKASRPYLEEIEHALKPSFVALVSMISV